MTGEMSNWEAFTAVLRDPVFLVLVAFALGFSGFVYWESRRYKVEPVVILLAVLAISGIIGCALVARMAVLTGYHR